MVMTYGWKIEITLRMLLWIISQKSSQPLTPSSPKGLVSPAISYVAAARMLLAPSDVESNAFSLT